jgi:hypothetical protein
VGNNAPASVFSTDNQAMPTLTELDFPLKLFDTSLGLTTDAREQLHAWTVYLRRVEGREFTRDEVLCRLLLTYRAPEMRA